MSDAAKLPNVGALLAPLLGKLEGPARAVFLARLERAAAQRYRAWAAQAPRHADALLACARSEEEIAERAERLFPLSAAQQGDVAALLPDALALYDATFAPFALREQLALQASAERQGGAAWRAIGAAPGLDASARETLAACAALEDASVARLGAILEQGALP